MKFGTYHKWRVPEKLFFYLLSVLDTKEEKCDFKREDYSVRNEYVQKIENEFGCRASRDGFASARNALCTEFWTEKDNALSQNWQKGETIWLNPPWSLCKKVAEKLKTSQSNAICILPAWERGWTKELVRKATKRIFFPPGTRLFEISGKPVGPIRWGGWALFISGNNGASSSSAPKTITLKNRMFRQSYPPRGTKRYFKDTQLLLRTKATLLNYEEININVLVDTGAEACLITQILLPQHLFYPASNTVRFETANGELMAGGNMCTKVTLLLNCETDELSGPDLVNFEVELNEANIKVDAILSYPWLAQAKLGIFPHHKALVLDSPGLKFLYGVRDHHKKHSPKFPAMSSVIGCVDCENANCDPIVAMPEKFGFHLPVQGFDQFCA